MFRAIKKNTTCTTMRSTTLDAKYLSIKTNDPKQFENFVQHLLFHMGSQIETNRLILLTIAETYRNSGPAVKIQFKSLAQQVASKLMLYVAYDFV